MADIEEHVGFPGELLRCNTFPGFQCIRVDNSIWIIRLGSGSIYVTVVCRRENDLRVRSGPQNIEHHQEKDILKHCCHQVCCCIG